MRLNEFLKEHNNSLKENATVQALQTETKAQAADITELKNANAKLEAEVKEQSALIQKVSNQLATVLPATPRLATNTGQ